MSNAARILALENALEEIKSVCPEISSTFVFRENGEILAKDQETTEVAVNNAQEAFNALQEKAKPIGEIDSVTFQGSKARANITRFNDFYVTNIASKEADQKTLANLTRVMIPTMLKLVQEICPSQQNSLEETAGNSEPEQSISPEPYLPEIQVSKLTVENLTGFGGFLNDPDVVRIDSALIAQWMEIFGDMNIAAITVEVPVTGKNMRCKFNPIKDSKFEGKNIIQIPEKLQQTLCVHKGTQVLIKPIIEYQNGADDVQDEAASVNEETTPRLAMETHSSYEPYIPSASISQLIVDNLRSFGGFMGSPDVVRVDNGIIARWKELFGDKEIEEVLIEETTTGKRVSCKFQPIKDSNLEGKGIIQLPEKIQQALQTKKGALVVVKPKVVTED